MTRGATTYMIEELMSCPTAMDSGAPAKPSEPGCVRYQQSGTVTRKFERSATTAEGRTMRCDCRKAFMLLSTVGSNGGVSDRVERWLGQLSLHSLGIAGRPGSCQRAQVAALAATRGGWPKVSRMASVCHQMAATTMHSSHWYTH